MPKLSYDISVEALSNATDDHAVHLKLDGLIDAANYQRFEKAMEDAAAENTRYLIVDFSAVHYVNSTGMSALIRFQEVFKERKGLLCLSSVAKDVGLAMHLLGVTSLIHFLPDVAAALELVKSHSAGGGSEATSTSESSDDGNGQRQQAAKALGTLRPRRSTTSNVLVLSPVESRFTNVLKRRFSEIKNDRYHLLHDPHQALRAFDSIQPDLIVVDERCDPTGDFVSRVKVQKERSLTSVIKTYASKTEVRDAIDFKIWENDFLVDPFDVRHFFSLTEAELERVPKDRRVFTQQVHFEFRAKEETIERAYKLADLIIRNAVMREEDQTAFYAAVKEAIDNAVQHGSESDPDKLIDVNFLVDQHKVTVLIEDQGAGFDFEYYLARIRGKEAFDEAKRRIVKEGVRGGLGILLMSRCSDRIEYSGCGNIIRLEKNLRAAV